MARLSAPKLDERRAPRLELELPCHIAMASGEVVNGVLRDASRVGFVLEGAFGVVRGARLHVQLVGNPTAIEGVVVRTDGAGVLGLNLTNERGIETVEALLRERGHEQDSAEHVVPDYLSFVQAVEDGDEQGW